MMFDTPAELTAFINSKGGNSQVMMFVFNNSYTKVFGDDEWNPSMIDSKGIFKFVEEDVQGNEYHVYKHLEYLESITMAPPGVDRKTIYYRNYRP